MSAKIYNFKDKYPVRVDESNHQEPWFVAKDVCKALGTSNHIDAVSRLDGDEKSGVGITDPHNKVQEMLVVNESGVYSLIFKSRNPTTACPTFTVKLA